ncbi:MAG: lysylphosphatidylglycerol synthase domain-containing protein [Acidimicrobiia bacterium]
MEKSGRMEQWRGRAFGPASELPYRRRTSDWIRVGVALLLMAVVIAHEGHENTSEESLFRLVNGLPNALEPLFQILYRFGALWAVGLVVIAALVARRWRLARDMAIAGLSAWFLGRVIGEIVVGNSSIMDGIDYARRVDSTPSFPLVRLAIIVAVIAVASPYLTRPMRRLGQLLILLMAFAALYLGTALPDAAFAAVVLGWGIAAIVHLIFGSPGGRPTTAQVAVALHELTGFDGTVTLAPKQPAYGTIMRSDSSDGPLWIRVLGRDEADAQLIAKLGRAVLYKDSGPKMHLTRLSEVEHEAYVTLLAERAEVRVPPVVVAGVAGPSAALLVIRPVGGTRLRDVDPASVTDAVLDDLWDQVRRLHEARVAHGALNARHIVLGDDGIAIVGFEQAAGSASGSQRAADVAELLVSTSDLVGDDRAIAAALRGMGTSSVVDSLPLIQPAALTRDLRSGNRKERRERSKAIAALRDATAAAAGTEAPPLQQLYRVSGTNLMMAIGTLIAVFALLSQVGDPQTFYDTIKDADWAWLAVAMFISLLTNFATAVALMGTVPINLPLVRTAELQLSMSFSNLAVPAVGGMAAQIRFLQRQGVDLASAVASGGLLINVGNIVAQVILLVFAVALSPTTLHTGKIPTDSIVEVILIALVVIAIAIGVIVGVPKVRNLVMPSIKNASATMWAAARSPRRVVELLGGNAINALMYAAVMDACLAAFGGSINFWTLLSINIFVSTIASLVPIPGGGTAVSSVGMSGALVAVGISNEVAVAAVLANQLVANFIPAVPGWWATNDLLHDDYL